MPKPPDVMLEPATDIAISEALLDLHAQSLQLAMDRYFVSKRYGFRLLADEWTFPTSDGAMVSIGKSGGTFDPDRNHTASPLTQVHVTSEERYLDQAVAADTIGSSWRGLQIRDLQDRPACVGESTLTVSELIAAAVNRNAKEFGIFVDFKLARQGTSRTTRSMALELSDGGDSFALGARRSVTRGTGPDLEAREFNMTQFSPPLHYLVRASMRNVVGKSPTRTNVTASYYNRSRAPAGETETGQRLDRSTVTPYRLLEARLHGERAVAYVSGLLAGKDARDGHDERHRPFVTNSFQAGYDRGFHDASI